MATIGNHEGHMPIECASTGCPIIKGPGTLDTMTTKNEAADPVPEDQQQATDSGTRTNLLARLERAAGDVSDNKDAYRAAVELRDQLVIEAHDSQAMTTTAIARAASISQSRVVEILAAH